MKQNFVQLCKRHHLPTLNINKTEEMAFDRKSTGDLSSWVVIHEQNTAQSVSYRYLGTSIHINNIKGHNVRVENVYTVFVD